MVVEATIVGSESLVLVCFGVSQCSCLFWHVEGWNTSQRDLFLS